MVGMISFFLIGEDGGGLTILIKSVLQSLSIYTLSTLTHLKGTLKLIEKHLVDFVFRGGSQGRSNFQISWLNLWVPCDEGVLVSKV